jgi:hypothetical protein
MGPSLMKFHRLRDVLTSAGGAATPGKYVVEVLFTDTLHTRRGSATAAPSWEQVSTGYVFGSPRDSRTTDYAGRFNQRCRLVRSD